MATAKKTINKIQAGDVVGIAFNWLNYTDQFCEQLVTVVGVAKTNLINDEGTACKGFSYVVTCSDGSTYRVTSGKTEYFIFN
jgi:hypothetical protein